MKQSPPPIDVGSSAEDLRAFLAAKKTKYGTVMADPPWQFVNRTGKMAPEHKRLSATRR